MAKKRAPKSAPKAVKKRPAPRRRRKSGDTNASGIIFIIGLVGLAFFNKEAAQLVAFGLLPTIVLGFTAKGDNKSQRMMCVAFANASGILILLGEVWSNPSAFDSVIVSPSNWIIMWGSAGVGYALNFVGPMIAAMIMQGMAQDRVKNINQQKQEIVELWSSEVLVGDDKPDLVASPRRPNR